MSAISPVALVGAYSMSNYGDRLYPPILECLLREQGVEGPFELYALMPGVLGDRRVRALSEIRGSAPALVVVGGGDLVRTDRKVVAMDHLCIETSRRRLLGARLAARRFVRDHFLDGPGAWLPARGWAEDAPVILSSVGVHELPPTAEVRSAVSQVAAAWVRNHVGGRRLIAAGLEPSRVVEAPDAVFILRDHVDVDATQVRGGELLRQATGQGGPVAVLHAAGFTGWSRKDVTMVLRALDGIPVVTLPLGAYAGEQDMLRKAASAANVPNLGLLETDDVTAVLAAAGCVISTSMHAAIVASVFGRPMVVPGIEKIEAALEACPDPPTFVSVPIDGIPAAVRDLLGQVVPASSQANADAARNAFRSALAGAQAGL